MRLIREIARQQAVVCVSSYPKNGGFMNKVKS